MRVTAKYTLGCESAVSVQGQRMLGSAVPIPSQYIVSDCTRHQGEALMAVRVLKETDV